MTDHITIIHLKLIIMKTSRREFLTLSGAGLMATVMPVSAISRSLLKGMISRFPFDLGIASYTFRKFYSKVFANCASYDISQYKHLFMAAVEEGLISLKS